MSDEQRPDLPGIYWQSRMGNNVDGIGGNCHRYDIVTQDPGHPAQRRSVIIDFGIKMGGDRPGHGCSFASPTGLLARQGADRLENGAPPAEALLLTHAHEDHLGGIRYAIDMGYQVPPVYCSAFTAQVLTKSLVNGGIASDRRPPITIVGPGESRPLAGADIDFIPVDHLPGSVAVRIRSADATIFHTGDYKFDHTLPLGPRADPAQLRGIGQQGVDLVISDSTATADPGAKVLERDIQRHLSEIVADHQGRAIVAGLLGTQLDRLASLAKAAAENDRLLLVTGRSLENNLFALRRSGIDLEALTGATVLPAAQGGHIAADRAIVVTTGAFAQRHAGLTRAADQMPGALLIDSGTTVIIPQRAIPPVRPAFQSVVTKLEQLGADVVTAENAVARGYGPIHQSGHAIESDARQLYDYLKPRHVIAPMHGGKAQLDSNARIAASLGIQALAFDHNGAVLHVHRHSGVRQVGQDRLERIVAIEQEGHRTMPRARKGEDRRDGPVPVIRYETRTDDISTGTRSKMALARLAQVVQRNGGRRG